ncbi:MAG: hypothetical protein HC810_07710, partial [Acaryochloridaceae cyanobacterium RL_2_7]|nr:hypothetical protein [Acaryochloridaceae cyanobacterium RL_2_7]
MVGLFLIGFGLAIVIQPSPIELAFNFFKSIILAVSHRLPGYTGFIAGAILIATGIFLLYLGQSRTLGSITEVLIPDQKSELVDKLL